MNFFKKIKHFSKGFTLVEMMVVVAIVIVMTSVLLFRQSKFSSDILVTNAAYEIALSIRQAQVFGISSKQALGSTPNVGYGVYFSNTAPITSFTIYSDTGCASNYYFNFNSTMLCGSSYEYAVVDTPMLSQGQTIKRFCSNGVCSDDSSSPLNKLNIGFVKPNPEALIYSNGSTPTTGNSGAVIIVASALGDKCRVVRISAIGQISVDTPLSGGGECNVKA